MKAFNKIKSKIKKFKKREEIVYIGIRTMAMAKSIVHINGSTMVSYWTKYQ